MCVSNSLNPVQLVTILQIYLYLEGNWYWTFFLLTSAVCNGEKKNSPFLGVGFSGKLD